MYCMTSHSGTLVPAGTHLLVSLLRAYTCHTHLLVSPLQLLLVRLPGAVLPHVDVRLLLAHKQRVLQPLHLRHRLTGARLVLLQHTLGLRDFARDFLSNDASIIYT